MATDLRVAIDGLQLVKEMVGGQHLTYPAHHHRARHVTSLQDFPAAVQNPYKSALQVATPVTFGVAKTTIKDKVNAKAQGNDEATQWLARADRILTAAITELTTQPQKKKARKTPHRTAAMFATAAMAGGASSSTSAYTTEVAAFRDQLTVANQERDEALNEVEDLAEEVRDLKEQLAGEKRARVAAVIRAEGAEGQVQGLTDQLAAKETLRAAAVSRAEGAEAQRDVKEGERLTAVAERAAAVVRAEGAEGQLQGLNNQLAAKETERAAAVAQRDAKEGERLQALAREIAKEAERVAAVGREQVAVGERNFAEQRRLWAVDELTKKQHELELLGGQDVHVLKGRLDDMKEQAAQGRLVGRPAVLTQVVHENNQEILNLTEKATTYREYIRYQNAPIPPHLRFELHCENQQQQQGPPPQQGTQQQQQQQQQPPGQD